VSTTFWGTLIVLVFSVSFYLMRVYWRMSVPPQHHDDDDDGDADDVPDQLDDAELDEVVRAPVANQITNEVDKDQIAQFVTTIKNAEQQVGEHIIAALQHADTVAVLTTVVIGPDGSQHVISAALNPKRMQQVQQILSAAEQERELENPCFGFHCLVKPKSPGTNPTTRT
jgi:hypothetical protein